MVVSAAPRVLHREGDWGAGLATKRRDDGLVDAGGESLPGVEGERQVPCSAVRVLPTSPGVPWVG